MLLSRIVYPFIFAWTVAAQGVVTVAPDDSALIVTQHGQRLTYVVVGRRIWLPLTSPFSVAELESPDLVNAGIYNVCGGLLLLNSSVDSTVTLLFTGAISSVPYASGCPSLISY